MTPMAGSAAFFVALGVAVIVPAQPASQGGPARPVTFTEDVAPLLFDRCAMCHHPDGPAPFSLLTFDDAKPRATLIAAATQAHFMPPWKTAPGGPEFVGQHPLSEQEIDVIRQWVANGAPQGDPRRMPVPRWSEGWQLGAPDLVVTLPQPFVLPPDGTDVSRVFVIPLPVTTLRYVRGLEFRPGNAKVVHHANIRIDPTRASRQLDEETPAPGYDGLILRSAVFPDGHFLGWTPGQVAPLLPKGLAWRLRPDSDLVVEVHMQPTGKPELVSPSIGLFFGDDPPDRVPLMLRLGRQNIDIAAGEADYTVADSFVLPVDVEVQAVQPHAHHRARHITGTALLPDGTSRSLIDIPDWDFRWQHVYRYVSPIALPKGTTIAMRYSYDNSAANARNPQQPPLRVTWGQWSRDEMGDLWIQVLTRSEQDRQQLNAAFRPKAIAEDAIGYEQMIRHRSGAFVPS